MRNRLREWTARQGIEAAALRLPEQRRAIFLAVAIQDANYAEIGQQVGLDPVEVEREFACALVGLAAAMDQQPPWWQRLPDWVAAWIRR